VKINDLFSYTVTGERELTKSNRQLENEIREVSAETRKRTNNRLDCEDQDARTQNLRDARYGRN
jgi:hypothetical protein